MCEANTSIRSNNSSLKSPPFLSKTETVHLKFALNQEWKTFSIRSQS